MNTRPQISSFILSFKNSVEGGIHFLYRLCIEPKSITEDTKRREFILNTILSGIIFLLLILDCFIAVAVHREGSSYRGMPLLCFTCIVITFIGLLCISRKGYYKIACFIFLVVYFLATTYGAVHWGVELPLVAISYVLIIIISSILISTRFAFISTSIISLMLIVVTILQIHRVIIPFLYWKYTPVRINDPVQLSIVFFVITGISWLSNREIEISLTRARTSEEALLEERNLLEIKVEERTKEVKEIQNEKIAQLYRFAEFGRLSTGIFHDLMNALNVVVANVSELEYSPETLPEVQSYLRKAVAASKRMGTNIENVRKQISNNGAITTFSLEKEIADAIDMVQHKARMASVGINYTVLQGSELEGNSFKFYQIILNLLGNAIEACEENEKESIVEIVLNFDKNTEQIILIIEDNGHGIAPELLDTVFTRFFTTKSYQKGIGLGLSQTKELIEKDFNGTIGVTSNKNKTTFTIIIPSKKPFIYESIGLTP